MAAVPSLRSVWPPRERRRRPPPVMVAGGKDSERPDCPLVRKPVCRRLSGIGRALPCPPYPSNSSLHGVGRAYLFTVSSMTNTLSGSARRLR